MVADFDEWEVKLTDLNGTVINTLSPPVGLTMAVQIVDALYRGDGIADNRALAIVPVLDKRATGQ